MSGQGGRTEADEDVRILAARLRITTDSKLGKVTPQWVLDLAAKPLGGGRHR